MLFARMISFFLSCVIEEKTLLLILSHQISQFMNFELLASDVSPRKAGILLKSLLKRYFHDILDVGEEDQMPSILEP